MTRHERLHDTGPALRRTSGSSEESRRNRRDLGRMAALGIALFGVSLGSFAPETQPDPGAATAAEVRRFATDNAGTIQVNTLAALASVALLIAFVAVLAEQIRHRRPDSVGPVVMAALAAVVAAQTLFLAAVSSVFGRPEQLTAVSDDAVVSFYHLLAVGEWLYTLTVLLPCAALVGTYSWYALRCRLVARWAAYFGFAVTLSAAVTTFFLIVPTVELDTLVVPLFGWWLWPLAVGGASGVRWWRTRQR